MDQRATIFFLLLFYLLANGHFALAQSSAVKNETIVFPAEKIEVYTDRGLYLSGDKIWFSAFCKQDGFLKKSDWSKVVYLEVHDENGQSFIREKYAIEKGLAAGALDLPTALPSGTYFLRAYTRYQQNQSPDQFFTRLIQVIQPSESIKQESADARQRPKPFSSSPGEINIDLSTDKKIYAPREKIELQLLLTSLLPEVETIVSVAVIKKGTAAAYTNHSLPISIAADQLAQIPELRGLNISGLVRDKNKDQAIPNVTCTVGVLAEKQEVHFTQTRSDGSFSFTLDKVFGEQDLYLGIQEENSSDMELLINNDFSTNFPSWQRIPLDIDSTQRKLIEELHINQQVQTNFPAPVLVEKNVDNSFLSYFSPPTIRRDLSSFIEVPSMEEVFNELVPSVFVKSQKGKSILTLVDGMTKEVYSDPLILLDGIPVLEIERLLEINPDRIKKVEIIDRKYVLGESLFNGVIFVYTKTADLAGMKWPENATFINYQGIKKEERFLMTNYTAGENTSERIPDFRTLLFWTPHFNMQNSGSSLQFYASDHSSEYEIILRGMTRTGKTCVGKTSFSVEKPN